jgi:hypothetical protein
MPDDRNFLGLYRSGTTSSVGVYTIADGALVTTLDADPAFGLCSGVVVAPDGKHAVAAYPVGLRVWNLQ